MQTIRRLFSSVLLTTCQTGIYLPYFLSASVDKPLLYRLCLGHHQAHHLPWRAQDRGTGRGQHCNHVKGGPGGTGVPSQKWTDPSVSRTNVSSGCREEPFVAALRCRCHSTSHRSLLLKRSAFHLCTVVCRLHQTSRLQYLMQ